ncbi:iron ABC transporter permease [Oceaniserpentilla sp. 4NH20-0058]|uniref:ABC transporter permease n=1 Tax=Oceaniserpentilla sp. 4NH20-0058 TaxID=3127660 RepID=UPI0031022CF1
MAQSKKLLPCLTLGISLVLFTPIIALVYQGFFSSDENDHTFSNILDTVVWQYLYNSFTVVSLTLIFACLFAIAPAWWCARYEFKGRRFLQWAMVFPLAIPAYISAYIYTKTLDYAGPIQSTLRDWFDWQSPDDYWFFDIRSLAGASLMLALALYPYIYLLLRFGFAKQSDHLDHAARLLGANSKQVFFNIRLPMARPALAVGCTLVAMETLADFGTVHLFSISTLTTAIYDSWLVYGSLSGAAKLSCLLLAFILGLSFLERQQRKTQKQFEPRGQQPLQRLPVTRTKNMSIWLVCMSILALGFVIPVLHLVDYAFTYFKQNWQADLFSHSQNTFVLAALAALICMVVALLLNAQLRFTTSKLNQVAISLGSLGYAIPGTVLAIAILIPLGALDLGLHELMTWAGQDSLGLLFSGSGFALLLAFMIRFIAIANGSLHSSYQQISPNLDLAASTLGKRKFEVFRWIHVPLIRPMAIAAFLLVFIECVKELPAALLLRPFDFETLSTYVYQHASDDQLEHAALASLLIIVVSLLPIALLSRTQRMP